MSGFLFALIASFVVGVGARDQALVAALGEQQGARPAVLVVAVLSAWASAAAASWAGAQVTPMLLPAARTMLVAMVLALAALELLFIRPLKSPAEPTESLFAFGAVLLAQQLTDATRFVIFALAAAAQLPVTTALGGAIGGSATVLAGWLLAGDLRHWPLTMVRRMLGLVLLGIAALLVFG
jgi:hypothetical protein